MNYSKTNKEIIVITGAGQGIGKEISKNVDKSYDLLLISKSSNCIKTANEIKKNNLKNNKNSQIIKYLVLNLEKKFNTNILNKKIKFRNYKNIHLILCAGVVDQKKKGYTNLDNWKKVFNVNLYSNIYIINFFLKFFRKNNKQNKIIIFSGGGAASSFKEFPIYSASKTALVRTVENYSEIFSKINISIFAIAPGAVKTNMLKKVEKISKVGTRSKMIDVIDFVNKSLKINTKSFSGKLIHIKDNLLKISKNKNPNYLKLRRVE